MSGPGLIQNITQSFYANMPPISSVSCGQQAAVAFSGAVPTTLCLDGTFYRHSRRLGAGAFGAVYEVVSGEGARFAIKVLNEGYRYDASSRNAFMEQARIMSEMDHRNIVKVHAWNMATSKNVPHIVMEYAGDLLFERVEQQSLRQRIRLARSLLDGVGYAHARGIVHGDLHHRNVFLHGSRVMIGDFYVHAPMPDLGQPLELTSGDISYPQLTPTSTFVAQRIAENTLMRTSIGKFIAPEVAQRKKVDELADIYSLGALLAYMFDDDLASDSKLLNVLLLAQDPNPDRRRSRFPSVTALGNQLAQAAQKDALPWGDRAAVRSDSPPARPRQHRLARDDLHVNLLFIMDHVRSFPHDLAQVTHVFHGAVAGLRGSYAHYMNELAGRYSKEGAVQLLWPEDARPDIFGEKVDVSSAIPLLLQLYYRFIPERCRHVEAAAKTFADRKLASARYNTDLHDLQRQLLWSFELCNGYGAVAAEIKFQLGEPDTGPYDYSRYMGGSIWQLYKSIGTG